MRLTLEMVESVLKNLHTNGITYSYDSSNERNSFYDKIGNYDVFYFYLNFKHKIEDVKDFLTSLDTKYICFDLLKYDVLWTKGEDFNPKILKWESRYRLNIQALFNKHKFFQDNKTLILSDNLKKLIEYRRISDNKPKAKEFN